MRFSTPPLRLSALALSGLMLSTGPLPVLAADSLDRQLLGQPGGSHTALQTSGNLLIAKDDDNDNKKKKKNKQEQQHKENKQKPQNKSNQQHNQQQQQNKLNQKERDRIYQEGLEKGRERGYKKGSEAGYNEGFDAGKDKGKTRGYRKGSEAGYNEGFDAGKDKGLNRGYKKGYDSGWDDRRAKDKNRWKDWDSNRWRDYNRRNRNVWTRRTVVNNNYYGYPGWARNAGWYRNRPWGGGWYGGWSSPPWGWWVGQSVVWGVTALTTAAIVNDAIDRAIERRQTTIIVPNTNWQLYYGTVQPYAQAGVTFSVNNGYGTYEMEADCEEGLLNGDVPSTAAEAQLINAACQVTYGGGYSNSY